MNPPSDPTANGHQSPLSAAQWQEVTARLGLSDRESQIVQHLFGDRTEREVSDALGISVHTVHSHIARLYRKLGVSTRCGLAARVLNTQTANDAPSGPGPDTQPEGA